MAYTKKSLGRPARKRRPLRLPVDHPPVDLLRRAGATEAVIAEVYRAWNDLSPEERLESAESLRNLTDDERRSAVLVTESLLATGHELDTDLLSEAERLMDSVPNATVPGVEHWAETNGVAGRVAALVVELRKPEDQRRKTLVEGLRAQLDG